MRGKHRSGRHGRGAAHMHASQQPAALPNSSALGSAADEPLDDELAEFKREAAQLMQKAQPKQHLPAGLDASILESAVKQLQNGLGLSKEDAEEALLAVYEEHGRHFEAWLDGAQMWLAVRQESDIEAAKMKEAMEESLREQAAKRAAEEAAAPPLTNLSEDRLRKKFAGSAVLPALDSMLPGSVLFSETAPLREMVKFKLVELLRLESNCGKWYAGAGVQEYFEDFGRRCTEKLNSTCCSCTQVTAEPDMLQQQQRVQQQEQQQEQQVQQQQQQQQQQGCKPFVEQQGKQKEQSPAPQQQRLLLQQQRAGQQTEQPQRQASVSSDIRPSTTGCTPSPSLAAAAAAAGEGDAAAPDAVADPVCGLKRSSRKRQVPSRYRSPSPSEPACGASKGSRKRTPTPELAAAAAAGAAAKLARTAGASSVASSRASSGATAMPPPAMPQPSPGIDAGPAAAAEAGTSSMAAASDQAAALQRRLADIAGALGQHPAVIWELSQLLAAEHQAVSAAIFAFPDAAGAVPDIFKSKQEAPAESDGNDSDIEVVAQVSTSAVAAAAAKTARRQGDASSDDEDDCTAGAAALDQPAAVTAATAGCTFTAAAAAAPPAATAAGGTTALPAALPGDTAGTAATVAAPPACFTAAPALLGPLGAAGPLGVGVPACGPLGAAGAMAGPLGYPDNAYQQHVMILQAYMVQQQAAMQQQAAQQQAAIQRAAQQQQWQQHEDDDVIVID